MNKQIFLLLVSMVLILGVFIYFFSGSRSMNPISNLNPQENGGGLENELHPLSIEALRKGEYPGSDIVVEETLEPGSNYQRYLVSYKSEGLKIYALLTVPNGEKPETGWPVVIFNHGYIPPAEYRTTERYLAYTDAFSRNGYVLLRPDYRGHGNSEGAATGAYGSKAYTVDVLNAVASLKREGTEVSLRPIRQAQGKQAQGLSSQIVNYEKIGMWGHSMGGYITLRNMVVRGDVKAGVIWAGVVASYPDLLNNWRRRSPSTSPIPGNINPARGWRQSLVEQYGEPDQNPQFWNSISASSFLPDISGPLQLHHGTADVSVPLIFSQKLEEQMKTAGKEVEAYYYSGDDHNLAANLGVALQRSVEFFDRFLKSFTLVE